MSLFKITVKTKNGNDIKNKQCVTAFFVVKKTKNTLTTKTEVKYTYKILHNGGMYDKKAVFNLKPPEGIDNFPKSAIVLRIVVNMFYTIKKILGNSNIIPDTILMISPLLTRASAIVTFIESLESNSKDDHSIKLVKDAWVSDLKEMAISDTDIFMLEGYLKEFSSTRIKFINPGSDEVKYKKSIDICSTLSQRLIYKS